MKKMLRFISLFTGIIMMLSVLPVMNVSAETDWTSLLPAKETVGTTFRLGVVSDSHIGVGQTTAGNLDKALDIFSAVDADAVAMNGDMTYALEEAKVTTGKYTYNEAEVGLSAALYSSLKGFIEANGTFTLAGRQEGDVFTTDTTQGKPII